MTDHQLHEFAARARECVAVPDFDELDRRGARRRATRRITAVGVAAALALTGYLAVGQRRDTAEQPIDRPDQVQGATEPYPGSAAWLPLDAGTYRLRLDHQDPPVTATFTTPDGWRGWFGPNRPVGRDGYVGLLLLTVDRVVARPCQPGTGGMDTVGPGAAALVEALTRMPRHRVTMRPRPDDRFGFPGTHLQVLAGAGVQCPHYEDFLLWHTQAGIIQAAGPHARLDLWVVDVHGTPVLVSATSMRGTPRWALRELDAVVDSVVLDAG
jgi:hypothetical protein